MSASPVTHGQTYTAERLKPGAERLPSFGRLRAEPIAKWENKEAAKLYTACKRLWLARTREKIQRWAKIAEGEK